jgi:hypothetical protein
MYKRMNGLVTTMLCVLLLLSCTSVKNDPGQNIIIEEEVFEGTRTIVSGAGEGLVIDTAIRIAQNSNTVTGYSDADFSGTYKIKDGKYTIKVKGRVEKKAVNFTLRIEGRIIENRFIGTFIQSFNNDAASQKGTIELVKK